MLHCLIFMLPFRKQFLSCIRRPMNLISKLLLVPPRTTWGI